MASTEQIGLNKTWELSLYELHRTPQDAIIDNTEIAVSPRSLHSELMCPICLDMLKKTMTTKECLHRFCSDCIITALRSGNKECPTCRKKLVSKRSLRPDPNFDLLISKIYPSRDEYEAHQEKILAKLNKNHSNAALVNSITEGIKLQSQNRQNRSRKNNEDRSVPEPAEQTNNQQPNVPEDEIVVHLFIYNNKLFSRNSFFNFIYNCILPCTVDLNAYFSFYSSLLQITRPRIRTPIRIRIITSVNRVLQDRGAVRRPNRRVPFPRTSVQ